MGFAAGHASAAEVPRGFSHDAYVWQRQWTPALTNALRSSASRIASWRVLAAEIGREKRLLRSMPDRAILRNTNRPVVLVFRIDGRVSEWHANVLLTEIVTVLADWRRSGLEISAIEIDHDCATFGLRPYAAFLASARRIIPQSVRLAITALPAWLGAAHLRAVLAEVDEAVFQVHSVVSPQHGLFDLALAREWVRQFATVTPVPFRVALPTYGSRVQWDENGRVLTVESEAPTRTRSSAEAFELEIQPESIATFLEELRSDTPRRLMGIAWFRVPTANDRRAWSQRTWEAVMDGQPLEARLEARAIPGDIDGVFDVVLENRGNRDGDLPTEVAVDAKANCLVADAVADYEFLREGGGIRFRRTHPGKLRADRRRVVGWIRCNEREVALNVVP